jgi:hypothetical protein
MTMFIVCNTKETMSPQKSMKSQVIYRNTPETNYSNAINHETYHESVKT